MALRFAVIGDGHALVLNRYLSRLLAPIGEVVLSRARPDGTLAFYRAEGRLTEQLGSVQPVHVVIFLLGAGNDVLEVDAYRERLRWAVDSTAGARFVVWVGPPRVAPGSVPVDDVAGRYRAALEALRTEVTAGFQSALLPAMNVTWIDSRPLTLEGHLQDGMTFSPSAYEKWARDIAAVVHGLVGPSTAAGVLDLHRFGGLPSHARNTNMADFGAIPPRLRAHLVARTVAAAGSRPVVDVRPGVPGVQPPLVHGPRFWHPVDIRPGIPGVQTPAEVLARRMDILRAYGTDDSDGLDVLGLGVPLRRDVRPGIPGQQTAREVLRRAQGGQPPRQIDVRPGIPGQQTRGDVIEHRQERREDRREDRMEARQEARQERREEAQEEAEEAMAIALGRMIPPRGQRRQERREARQEHREEAMSLFGLDANPPGPRGGPGRAGPGGGPPPLAAKLATMKLDDVVAQVKDHRAKIHAAREAADRDLDQEDEDHEKGRVKPGDLKKRQGKRKLAAAKSTALHLRRHRLHLAHTVLEQAKEEKDSKQADALKKIAVAILSAPIAVEKGRVRVVCPKGKMGDFGFLPGSAYSGSERVPQAPSGIYPESTPELVRRAIMQAGAPAAALAMPAPIVTPTFHPLPPGVATAQPHLPVLHPIPPRVLPIVLPPVGPSVAAKVIIPAAKQHPAHHVRVILRPGAPPPGPIKIPVKAVIASTIRPALHDMGWLGADALVADVAGAFGDVVLAADGLDVFDLGAAAKGKGGKQHAFRIKLRARRSKLTQGMTVALLGLGGPGISAAVLTKIAGHHAGEEEEVAQKAGHKVDGGKRKARVAALLAVFRKAGAAKPCA